MTEMHVPDCPAVIQPPPPYRRRPQVAFGGTRIRRQPGWQPPTQESLLTDSTILDHNLYNSHGWRDKEMIFGC